MGPCSWIHWSYLVPHTQPEVVGLMEPWNGLLKTQLGGNGWQGWGEVLQKAVLYML